MAVSVAGGSRGHGTDSTSLSDTAKRLSDTLSDTERRPQVLAGQADRRKPNKKARLGLVPSGLEVEAAGIAPMSLIFQVIFEKALAPNGGMYACTLPARTKLFEGLSPFGPV